MNEKTQITPEEWVANFLAAEPEQQLRIAKRLIEHVEQSHRCPDITAIRELHRDAGASQGYLENGGYGVIDHCCGTCGTHGEYGEPWPCETYKLATI